MPCVRCFVEYDNLEGLVCDDCEASVTEFEVAKTWRYKKDPKQYAKLVILPDPPPRFDREDPFR